MGSHHASRYPRFSALSHQPQGHEPALADQSRRRIALCRGRHDHHRRPYHSQDRQYGGLKKSMGVAVFAFIVIFLLFGSAGLILFYREAILQRIASVTSGRGERKPKGIVSTIHQTGLSLSVVVEQFEKVMPKNERDISSARQKLIRAGFRGESAIKILQGSKLFVPVVLCALLLVTGAWRFSPLFLFLVAAGIGYLAPDMWLRRQVVLRQRRIRRGLPDVLDLMIICVEAGLSLDQATIRTSQELRLAQPDLSDELGVVVLEQAAGKPRAEAWKGLADRTDVDSIRNLVSVLVQE